MAQVSVMNLAPNKDARKCELVLLAPHIDQIPTCLTGRTLDESRHYELLSAMQTMRGTLYLEEGALELSQISADGRHRLPVDDNAWHILTLDQHGEVVGCARYMSHKNTASFTELGLSGSALAKSDHWGEKLRSAVEADIRYARHLGVDYVEVGGWAISPKFRNTSHALRIALAAYSLGRILGGCVGVGTVTQRNLSSSILRRMGGHSLRVDDVELPAYFDSGYGCQMEILRFESALPNPRFEGWVQELENYLVTAQTYSFDSSLQNLQSALNGWDTDRKSAKGFVSFSVSLK